MKKILALAIGLLVGTVIALGQTAPAPTRDSLPNNIYAIGGTINPNASPIGSGTLMYGRLTDGSKGTYAIGVIDAVPVINGASATVTSGGTTTTVPLSVTTTTSAGIAQMFLNNGNLKIFATTVRRPVVHLDKYGVCVCPGRHGDLRSNAQVCGRLRRQALQKQRERVGDAAYAEHHVSV